MRIHVLSEAVLRTFFMRPMRRDRQNGGKWYNFLEIRLKHTTNELFDVELE